MVILPIEDFSDPLHLWASMAEGYIYKCLHRQDKAIQHLAEELDEMHHLTDQLRMYSQMVNTQCEQITKTQSLVLEHVNLNSVISAITTRSGAVIQGPKGPPEWEESQRQKEKETQEMSQ